MIERIDMILGHRGFREFTWQPDLEPFTRHNLIYGRNGAGKSSLAAVFRAIGGSEEAHASAILATIGGTAHEIHEQKRYPPVQTRVFDREYVDSSITSAMTDVGAIFYLGPNVIETRNRIELAKREISEAEAGLQAASERMKENEEATATARRSGIARAREILMGTAEKRYESYGLAQFEANMKVVIESPETYTLRPTGFEKCLRNRSLEILDAIPRVKKSQHSMSDLGKQVARVLSRLGSVPRPAHWSNSSEAEWVSEGVRLHIDADRCLFCAREMDHARLHAIEATLGGGRPGMLRRLADLRARIRSESEALGAIHLCESSAFASTLRTEARAKLATMRSEIRFREARLAAFAFRLAQQPPAYDFESATMDSANHRTRDESPDTGSDRRWEDAILSWNCLVSAHNELVGNNRSLVQSAVISIERHIAAETAHHLQELGAHFSRLDGEVVEFRVLLGDLRRDLKTLENKLLESVTPAEELNDELFSYLGRPELTFQVAETGYRIVRNGALASNLSEGEKTAIALLYFLKSLRSANFDLTESVLVLDDPVSSLDSESMYSALGFIKDRTASAKQLFILTHNFDFFRQVRDWFRHIRSPRAHFYMISKSRLPTGDYTSTIRTLDPMLLRFDSEYQSIFSTVFNTAFSELDHYSPELHLMPNAARRLLESFFAFHYPQFRDLRVSLQNSSFPNDQAHRILHFIHTHSHKRQIDDCINDPFLPAETQIVMRLVLKVIETLSPLHYAGMLQVTTGASPETQPG